MNKDVRSDVRALLCASFCIRMLQDRAISFLFYLYDSYLPADDFDSL